MATTKSKKVSNGRPTTAETAVKKMADFVEQVINSLGVELASGRITKKTYDAAIVKLDEVFKETEYLWGEVGFLEKYADELDADSKKKVEDLTNYYEGLIAELEKEYQDKVEAAYRTGSENIDVIYGSFNATCDNMKTKLDESHLLDEVHELKVQLQNKTAEAEEARIDAEYAESVAYDEFKSRKAIEEEYVSCKKQRDKLEAELHELQKKNQIRAKSSVRITDSYERAQKRIITLERELSVVRDKLDGIKRNLIQSLLCEELGVPENVNYGIKRAKALKKAAKTAKHNKTLATKLQNVATKLKENYPDWFVDEETVGEELTSATRTEGSGKTVLSQVKSTLKSTIYKGSVIAKTTALLLLAGLAGVSAAFGIKANADNKTIGQKDMANMALASENSDLANTNSQQYQYIGTLEEENETAKRNWSDTQRELEDTQQKLDEANQQIEDMKIQEKQDFVLDGSAVNSKVAEIVSRRAFGTIKNVAFTYSAKTGEVIMTAFVEQEGETVLVVGETTINPGCKLDAESAQKCITKMVTKAYNRYDAETGIYYNVMTAKRSVGETCVAGACKVQLGADGSIIEVLQSSYSKTGNSVDKQSVVNYVISDILNQDSQNVNE